MGEAGAEPFRPTLRTSNLSGWVRETAKMILRRQRGRDRDKQRNRTNKHLQKDR
jgi:hypothetical protein